MHLTITAASTALFSTWVFVENFGLLLDAGDGVSAALGQKSRKIRHVFITHADRDHVCGLLQLHQLNARDGSPSIHYPKDCGSFPALREFMARFDPQSGPASWVRLSPGDAIHLDKAVFVEARSSDHVHVENQVKALSYTVCGIRRTLKSALVGKSGADIGSIRKAEGEDAVTDVQIDKLVGYSGDASQLQPAHWSGVKVLIHEATFLDAETARHSHSNLPDVMAASACLELEALVLIHFSARYDADEIKSAIRSNASSARLRFPVFAVLPGQLVTDLLSTDPVWSPPA